MAAGYDLGVNSYIRNRWTLSNLSIRWRNWDYIGWS